MNVDYEENKFECFGVVYEATADYWCCDSSLTIIVQR